MIGDSDKDTNFPHELVLDDRQMLRLCKDFAKNSSAAMKQSNTRLSKMVQLGGFVINPIKMAKLLEKSIFGI